MAQTLLLKRSAIPGKIPATSDLALGEVGVNTFDGRMYIKRNDGTATIKEIGGDQFPVQTGNNGKFLKTDGTSTFWSATGGTSSNIVQNVHSFTIGNVLRFNGTAYVLSSSIDASVSDVVGIVTAIVDANTFELTTSGFIVGLSGFVPSRSYFLSDTTPGALTDVEPSAIGTISKPLFIAITTTTGLFYNWRGIANVRPIEINALLPSQTGNNGNVLISDGSTVGWVSVAAATASNTVALVGHGFVVGNIVKATTTPAVPYALAQANNTANSLVYGIISAVSLSGYTVTTSGAVYGLTSLTQGSLYYLSDSTPGTLTTIEPVALNSISKPLLIATSTGDGVFFNQRGLSVGIAAAVPAQLLPTLTGQAGKFLTNNGSTPSWAPIVSGVSSVNGYTGAVTLSAAHLSSVLGTTPVQNADAAGSSTLISLTDAANAASVGYIPFAYAPTGIQQLRTDPGITYNASTNVLSTTATSAYYADLAEKYTTDVVYDTGTVVVVSMDDSVECSISTESSQYVVGVISAKPAFIMNADSPGQTVALIGRVPVRIIGPITKGQRVITSNVAGCATAGTLLSFATALTTDMNEGEKLVECVIIK